MYIWDLSDLKLALENSLIKSSIVNYLKIDQLVIDSRKATNSCIFLALKGDNNDGHKFIEQAIENGSTNIIIDNPDYFKQSNSCNYFLVQNSFDALYEMAKFSRKRSKAKIIAVTGSVGKTSVKEMLKLVFNNLGKTFASQGNYNNHIGLPLCLANFAADHDFGVFEIGMNHSGEIEPLSKLLQPDLAIISNVYPVHIENFKNETGVAKAKSEIFSGVSRNGYALINQDSQHLNTIKSEAKKIGIKNIFTFGNNQFSDFQIVDFTLGDKSSVTAKIKQNGQVIKYELPVPQESMVKNSIICLAALTIFNFDAELGIKSLKKILAVEGRGNIIKVILAGKKVTIIDDSYNANAFSMINGINYSLTLKSDRNRLIIALGDMLELGDRSSELHQKVLNHLEGKPFDELLLVGKEMKKAANDLGLTLFKSFPDSKSAKEYIFQNIQENDLLYVKGSRGIKMETIFKE